MSRIIRAIPFSVERFQPEIQIFLYLQVLDLLTTLIGFRIGLGEASPFVRLLIGFGPVAGVMASKAIAVLLAGYCLVNGRERVIRWINYWFAALVVWNLTLILSV